MTDLERSRRTIFNPKIDISLILVKTEREFTWEHGRPAYLIKSSLKLTGWDLVHETLLLMTVCTHGYLNLIQLGQSMFVHVVATTRPG